MTPGQRSAARAIAGGAACLALAAAWACLPDLAITPLPDLPPSACGDGYVDPDAGETCDPGEAGTSSTTCPLCRMTCVSGAPAFLDPASNHCYFVVPGPLVKAIAPSIDACEEAGAHVVRIVSDREMTRVATEAPTSLYWIGLRRGATPTYTSVEDTIEPGWSSDCSGCYGRVPEAGGLLAGECLVGSNLPGADWSRSPCASDAGTFGRVTLCEQEPPGSRATKCLGDKLCFSVPATLGGPGGDTSAKAKRYVLIPTLYAYGDAAAACLALGATLVTFDSREEREQVAAVAASLPQGGYTDFWVGLTRSKGGDWGWSAALDAGEVWGAAQPNDLTGTHAYVQIQLNKPDSALARVAGDNEQHFPICQQ